MSEICKRCEKARKVREKKAALNVLKGKNGKEGNHQLKRTSRKHRKAEQNPAQQRQKKSPPRKGKTGNGPGIWLENYREGKGMKYQHNKLGTTLEYRVKTGQLSEVPSGEVWFDGYDPEKNELIDCKDWSPGFPKENLEIGIQKMLDARKQAAVAQEKGVMVRWEVPTEEEKLHLEKLCENWFSDRADLRKHIRIVVNPK